MKPRSRQPFACEIECFVCSLAALFVSDPDGTFTDGERKACPRCGVVQWIVADGEVAWVQSEELAEDRGQARCDGSHCGGGGALKEFYGTPCRFDCARVDRNQLTNKEAVMTEAEAVPETPAETPAVETPDAQADGAAPPAEAEGA